MRFPLFSTLLVSSGVLLAGAGTSAAQPSEWEAGAMTQPRIVSAQLVVQPDRTVLAYPDQFDTFDPAVPYTATVPLQGGSSWQMPLQYDQSRNCWHGRAPANIEIVAGPVSIRIGSPRRAYDDDDDDDYGQLDNAQFDNARFGPVRVFADPYSLDVVMLGDGRIRASIVDPSVPFDRLTGARVVLGYDVSGVRQSVTLAWDPNSRCFCGRARSASWWGLSPYSAHCSQGAYSAPPAYPTPPAYYPSTPSYEYYPSAPSYEYYPSNEYYPPTYQTYPRAVYPRAYYPSVRQPTVVYRHIHRSRPVVRRAPRVIHEHVYAPAPPAYRTRRSTRLIVR